MSENIKKNILWAILIILLLASLVLASRVGDLAINKNLTVGDVTKLMTTFFVIALFVERTLEVFITAWRGQETTRRDNDAQAANQALAQNPADPALQQDAKNKKDL